jgi:hypothetical protein
MLSVVNELQDVHSGGLLFLKKKKKSLLHEFSPDALEVIQSSEGVDLGTALLRGLAVSRPLPKQTTGWKIHVPNVFTNSSYNAVFQCPGKALLCDQRRMLACSGYRSKQQQANW